MEGTGGDPPCVGCLYGDADIVSVVAEFISELQEQQPADAPSAQDSIAASGEEAVVPLAPP